jgi:hypothetical protein
MMTDTLATHVLTTAGREFHSLKDLADKALAQIDDTAFFATLDDQTNSIAIMVKHLAGNMRSRWTDFLTTDGEKPDRDRDREFVLDAGDTRAALMARWQAAWELPFVTLESLHGSDLEAAVHVRGEPLSVTQAIYRQLTHYAYHVGQIVLQARHARGDAWRTLSIARGSSATFNARVRTWHPGTPGQA